MKYTGIKDNIHCLLNTKELSSLFVKCCKALRIFITKARNPCSHVHVFTFHKIVNYLRTNHTLFSHFLHYTAKQNRSTLSYTLSDHSQFWKLPLPLPVCTFCPWQWDAWHCSSGPWGHRCLLRTCLCVISGLSDVRRRGHRLLPGGVGTAPACSTRLVQTCYAGELWSPGLTG